MCWMMMWITSSLLFSLLISVVQGTCQFPADWHGHWIVNGYNSIIRMEIRRDNIIGSNSAGKCSRWDGDNKYLLYKSSLDDDGKLRNCYTCLVFTVRHANAIQYKRGSLCNVEDDGNLMNKVCSQDGLTPRGDLVTIVRANAAPVACPELFHQRSTFQYDASNGYCTDSPVQDSRIYQCAADSHVRMEFMSCQNPYYERRDDEFVCLASWEDGGNWMFVKYGDNYRCMYYDDTSNSALAISADATCTGLSLVASSPIDVAWSEVEGSSTGSSAGCTYPSWFSQTEWVDLQAEYIYRFDQSTKQLVVDDRKTNVAQQRHTCHQKERNNHYITEAINGCDHGYQCVIFEKKSATVTELIIGEIAQDPTSACSHRNIISHKAQTKLLRDNNAAGVSCPIQGVYSLTTSGGSCTPSLEASCTSASSITIDQCNGIKQKLECLASWSEDGVKRLIISNSSSPHQSNCYKYGNLENDRIIDIDEKCNFNAPHIFNYSHLRPPFQLLNLTRSCTGATNQGSLKDNYRTSERSIGNLAMRSSANILHVTLGSLLLTLLTFVL